MLKVIAINADGAYSVDLWTNNFKKIESIEKIARSNNARYVQSSLLYKGIGVKKAVIKTKFESKEDRKKFLRSIGIFIKHPKL